MHLNYVIRFISLAFAVTLTFGCASYKQNLLFRPDENFSNDAFKSYSAKLEKDQKIQKSDFLSIEVFTNCGERIVDPNDEIEKNKDRDSRQTNNFASGGGRANLVNPFDLTSTIDPTGIFQHSSNRKYYVDERGNVNLPKVGEVTIENLTLADASKLLERLYSAYYVDPYVIVRYTNKRVTVIGALGNRILPLHNENMNLVEVLALVGNMDENSRANRIRLIRNIHTGKPIMKEIDLTTYEGLLSAELKVMPHDIIYVEPRRRPFKEFVNDLGTVSNVISSAMMIILTTVFLLDRAGGK